MERVDQEIACGGVLKEGGRERCRKRERNTVRSVGGGGMRGTGRRERERREGEGRRRRDTILCVRLAHSKKRNI